MFVYQLYQCTNAYTHDTFHWVANEGSEERILYIDLLFMEL